LERFLSWAPLRNWMFLNFEWPAMGPLSYWLLAFAVRPRLIGVGPPEIQWSPFRVHKDPLSEALTLMARQLKVREHFRRAVPAASFEGAIMTQTSKMTDRAMPTVSLSALCSEAADLVAKARLSLFDESGDADRALLHLDEAIFCLKRLLAHGRAGMSGARARLHSA
jgi:hypothetical protein